MTRSYRLQWALAPRPRFHLVVGQSSTAVLPPPDATGAIAVVIGARGARGLPGDPGPAGQDGDGAADPGDLTLIFENKLI